MERCKSAGGRTVSSVERHGIVYLVARPDGRRVYVGKTVRTLEKRWAAHIYGAQRGNKLRLQRAIRKYGAERMRVLQIDYATSEAALNAKEQFWIALLHSKDPARGYNLTAGGEGTSGLEFSPEHRAKLAAAARSPETRAKMSAAARARWARKRLEVAARERGAVGGSGTMAAGDTYLE